MYIVVFFLCSLIYRCVLLGCRSVTRENIINKKGNIYVVSKKYPVLRNNKKYSRFAGKILVYIKEDLNKWRNTLGPRIGKVKVREVAVPPK